MHQIGIVFRRKAGSTKKTQDLADLATGLQCNSRMDGITSIAASGLRSRSEELEQLAADLSNVGTARYKGNGRRHQAYASIELSPSSSDVDISPPSTTRAADWLNLGQGSLENTGNSSDVALSGEGFFQLQSGKQRLLSRGGSIRAGKDGVLVNEQGFQFVGTNGKTIQIDAHRPFMVDRQGNVAQEGVTVGTLLVSAPSQLDALSRGPSGTFFWGGRPASMNAAQAEVRQGFQETSNVNAAEGSIRLIRVMREFESMQRALQVGGDMSRQALDQVARVQG